MQKSISVTSNDPNDPVIMLMLVADIVAEITIEPARIFFKDMEQGEKKSEKVKLINTSSVPLEILPIKTINEMFKIDLINCQPEWPIELKPNDILELLVTFTYNTNDPRLNTQINIKYTGGEGTDAYLRFSATLAMKPIEPEPKDSPVPKNVPKVKGFPDSVQNMPRNKSPITNPPNPPNTDIDDNKQ